MGAMDFLSEIDTRTKIQIASHLFNLANKRTPPLADYGICGNIQRFTHGHRIGANFIVKEASALWPKFSGNKLYPVPHRSADARSAFKFYPLWGNDEHGDNRRELCAFIAVKIIDSL